jgi:hypothetical protein
LEEYLPKTPYGWLSAWGSRVVIDDKGFPAVIGYGQWAIPVRETNRILLRFAKQNAREKAEILARSYIADFVNSRLALEELTRTEREVSVEKVRKLSEEGKKVENVEKDIVRDIFSKKLKKFSKVNLKGIKILKDKSFLITIGGRDYIVYVVAAGWSYEDWLKLKRGEVKNSHGEDWEGMKSEKAENFILETPESPEIYDW